MSASARPVVHSHALFERVGLAPRIVARLCALTRWAALALMALGVGALAGWALGVEALKNVLPGLVAMKPNTALAFVFSGASLWLWTGSGSRKELALARGCALVVTALGALTLIEHLAAVDLGIDQRLLPQPPGTTGTAVPVRMAATTAGSFALLGLGLATLGATRRGARTIPPGAAFAGGAVSLTNLFGYLFGAAAFYSFDSGTQMALHTAAGLLILSGGLLALAAPGFGLLFGDGAGGVMARRLLPAALAVPFGFALLRLWGQRAGLYGTEVGVALQTLASIACLALVAYWCARLLDRLDRTRAAAHDEFVRSEERFRATFEQAAVGIAHVAFDGRLLRVNRKFSEITGYGGDELLARTLQEITHPDDLAADLGIVRQLLAGEIDTYSLEKRYLSKGGDPVWVNLTVSLVGATEERAGYFIGVVEEIGARRKIEATLEASLHDLERSNQELQEFAFVASHDLQEPLRKIVTFADLLRSRAAVGLDDEARDLVARMASAAERMSELIERLLELSRITTQRRKLVRTDLDEVARAVLGDLEVRIRETGARVAVEPLPTIAADPEQMRRLLQNLIGNALKFHARERPPAVRVWSERVGSDRWRVSVADDGIGFDEKYLDRIFKPFQRLHSRGEFAGSGMGLAICRRIVARHGGELTARSRPGEGSTFEFTLPERQQGA